MSKNIVADFSAFLSVTVDEQQLFETEEGRVVVTRETITFAGDDTKHKLSLDAVAEFDFRTVPPQWEQFFDDLVGIRFEDNGEETTATIGTDTDVADRFVTVLLKLLVDGSDVTVRQRHYPIADADDESHDEETTITLHPKSESITFDAAVLHEIDIGTMTGVEAGEGEAIVIRHLCPDGRIGTQITSDTSRHAQFLRTYLNFRSEITTGAGPVRFLFVGEDRDALVLVAKLLKHRNLSFEAGHAETVDEAHEMLASADVPMECIVSEYELGETTAIDLRAELSEAGHDAPMVCITRDSNRQQNIPDEDGVDVVQIGSRTEHYEDIADAIERAVISARVK